MSEEALMCCPYNSNMKSKRYYTGLFHEKKDYQYRPKENRRRKMNIVNATGGNGGNNKRPNSSKKRSSSCKLRGGKRKDENGDSLYAILPAENPNE